ncbi:MAG: M23 family metallopeptidase [Gemmatimonadota bacterium]|nr:M23 family metallopeptidase [Gemmatimonadota bacterium]
MAWAAVQLTPAIAPRVSPTDPAALAATNRTIAASALTTLDPVVVSVPESSVPELRFNPVVVEASLQPGVDTVALTGTIHSSLLASLLHVGQGELPAGQRRSIAWNLADIFEHRLDMSRDLDEGDRFHVLVERLQQPNGKIIVNKILGAKLSLGDQVVEAIHFKSRNSSSEWFDGRGKSLTATFLRTPVNFRRITSVFGLRVHPIFGTWRNHTGTDYAAPMGTPVHAIGDGIVAAAGPHGGYGNMIDIRHSSGMISRYGHMSRLARGIHDGSRVKMGETIGYVGMTGWATGPHLHFEIRENGVAHDPKVALRNQTGEPVSGSESILFNEIREHTLAVMATSDEPKRVAMR